MLLCYAYLQTCIQLSSQQRARSAASPRNAPTCSVGNGFMIGSAVSAHLTGIHIQSPTQYMHESGSAAVGVLITCAYDRA